MAVALTVPQAARQIGRNPETVRRWIRAGKLRATKVGTQHVIEEDDLTNLVRGVTDNVSTSRTVAALDRTPSAWPARVSEAIAPYSSAVPPRRAPVAVGDTWLPAIVGRIVRLVDPVRIILFGSRARGDAREDSDYDLLVVFDEIDDRRATRIRIRSAIDDLPVAKDIVVATTEEESWAPRLLGDVLQAAIAEGRVVYERA
jgi:excisionase family DNA binding protein